SSLYTLATEPPQVAASAQVSASGQVAPLSSCHLLSHQALLWHHRQGNPSLPRLRGIHSRLLVSGLPKSLPPLPPSPAPPCLPCVEGRQRAAPHSSSFPPMIAPLHTLYMDVWGPACVSGQGRERYFLLVVDDYTRYTTVFPLRSKGQVVDVLIPWIRAVCLQLRERFRVDLPVLRLHFDRGGEFSSDLLRDFCRGEGILQSFTLSNSPLQNGIAERRIGLVMEVARTSMIHVATPDFLWLFAVRYAAHQLNLWPRVSLPETSPTLRWTRKVGDASVFRVWGSRAFVLDTSADKLFARAIFCVFLGFVLDAPGWQFYHPTSRHVLPSQDVTFDESVPFYCLFPYRSAPLPPPQLFLAPGPPPVYPLPPQGPAPSGVSQVEPPLGAVPGEVAVDSRAARGTSSRGAEPGGDEPGGADPGGAETGGAEPGGTEIGGAETGGAELEGVEPWGSAGALPRLSPQQLLEWLVRRARLRSGGTGAGGAGAAGAGGARVTTRGGFPGGTAATGPRGARTQGPGVAETGGVRGAGAGDPTESGAAGAGGSYAGGAGAGGAGVGGTIAGGAGAGGAGAIDPGGTVRPRPYFVPLLQQVLSVPSCTGLTRPLLCPPPDQSQPTLHPASPLPAPSPYSEQPGGLTEHREPASRPASPVRTSRRVPRPRPPPVPGTHAMALRPSSVPLCVPLLPPPESSLPTVPDPESDCVRAASPTVSCLLATAGIHPSFESAAASALIAELLDFAAACRLDYATALVAESEQGEFECLAATVPHFASVLLAPEGDPDAPDIPTPRSYAEAITGVDYFQTFSPTPKMTTLWVLLHVAAQHDYKLQYLDFSTSFLQGSLHEEIWLRRPPGFTWSFPAGTQWSLRRPVYGLRQAPREWHDTLRTTLGRERYFLLVVDDYTRYTTVFPLRSKGQVVDVLIPWIRTVRLQLRKRFRSDLPFLRLHSDRGGEFSSDLLRDFCRGEVILQSFTLPDSPQQNGIAERCIFLVMEVARTSMIHAASPHFLWPFAVEYAAHTLRWTGNVCDASVFRVWGSRAFVRDPSSDKLSAHAIPCPRVFPSQDVTFDESVPFYRLFPYRSVPPSPPPLFLAPDPPSVDPLPPQGLAPSSVSQVDPLLGTALVEVAVGSGAARGAASGGAAPGGAEPGVVESEGAGSGDAELGGEEPGGAEPVGVEPRGHADASPRLSPQQLREWLVRRARLCSGATGVGGAGFTAGAGGTGGTAATGPGGARTRGTRAAGTGGVGAAGAGDPTEPGGGGSGAGGAGAGGAGGAGGTSVGGAGVGGTRAGGAGAGCTDAGGAGVGGPGAGGAGSGGVGAVDPRGTVRPRPYFVPLLQQVLGVPSSTSLTPPLLCPPPDLSELPLQPASPLPSPYTEQSGNLTELRLVLSCLFSLPDMFLVCVLLLSPARTLWHFSDVVPAASPTVSRLLAIVVTDPSFESVAGLLDFAAHYRLDYAASLVAESKSASVCPPSVGGECALGTDVLQDRQEEFECFAATVPHLVSMLLAPEGDPDQPDIPTPRSYAEAIEGPYSSQWHATMDAEMASWKSTGTYVDEVPPPGVNIVSGMWIFRVKRPPGSPPVFKAPYVARGFSQRQGVDFFHTFSPTPKMTTLRVLLHVAAQRDYDLHSLYFSTAFLQGSLHKEIWLRRPPGFTGTTLAALGFTPSTADSSLFLRTDTSLPPFYILVYVDDLVFATTDIDALTLVLQRFGFQFSSPQPTPLSTGHSLSAPPSDESVEPSGPYPELVGCLIAHTGIRTRDLRSDTITLVMGLVLGGRGPVVLTGHADASWVDDLATQRSSLGYTFILGSGSISWQSTRSSSVLSSNCEAEIYAGAMAAQELRWLTYCTC
ncbi:unnamed protein product, partial [Closterium sp. NIES-53]